MKAVVIGEPGGPEVLRLEERPTPHPGRGEVLVRVRTSALNRADLLQRRGRYPPPPGAPQDVPGLEYAGEIEALGEDVAGWRVGQRVMGIVGGGAHAEYVLTRADELLEIPEAISWEDAGAVPEAFVTAYDALFRQGELRSGERVLIHAVASGIGTAALQLAERAGAITLGTSRTPSKLERARALGLQHAIDGSGAWWEEARRIVGPGGLEVVLELVGGPAVARGVELLGTRGRMLIVGLVGGAKTEVDLGLVLRNRLSIIGTILRTRPPRERAELTRDFASEVLPMLAEGTLQPVIDRVVSFVDVADAHRQMERNDTFGKIVLAW